MKKKLLFMMTFLAIAGMVSAQNALTVTDFTLPQNGGKVVVNLTLGEASVYTSYQFKVETPAGVAYVVDKDNDVECTLGTGHTTSHGATAHWNATDKLLTIGVISTGSTLLTGQSVTLEIPLAATTATVGTQYNFTIKDITFIRQSGAKDYLSNVSFKATVGVPEVVRIVFDEEASSLPNYTAGATANVKVKRTIKANEWSTICLPFAMTATQVTDAFGDDVELGNFIKYETIDDNDDNTIGLTVNFEEATAIEANHPYIIKVSQAVTEFTVDKVTIDPEDNPCVEYDNGKTGTKRQVYGTFQGTYVADFNFYQNALNEGCKALFLNGNKFYYATSITKRMKAFRAYFYFEDHLAELDEASARIIMSFDNESTKIDMRTMEPIATGKAYNMAGQYVGEVENADRLPKGVYIIDGKKKVIK